MSVHVRMLSRADPLEDVALASELTGRFLVFDAFAGGQRRVDLHPLVLSAEQHRAAVRAAEGVTRTMLSVSARAFEEEAEAARYRFEPDVLALARASHRAGDDASLVRVDLLLDADERFVACEVNADCPGGHNEAMALPHLARRSGFHVATSPTRVLDALAARLEELAGGAAVALMYATAYAEDLQVCALVARALRARGVRAILCPPTAPRLRGGRLCVNGEIVGALYRFFPTEYMEGQNNLGDLIAAIESGAVRTISSFAHMFAQSKLSFARAWASGHGEHIPETRDLSELAPERLIAERGQWVIKKALGRVGDEVFVGPLHEDAEWREVVREVCGRAESWIAQRFVRQRAIASPFGDRLMTLGAYVLDGKFVGYFARVTASSHVSHDALCLPVFVE